jgi:homoserine O-acetyltransferase
LGNGRIRTNNNKINSNTTDWKATDWLIANCFKEQILIIHLNLFKMPAHICCVIELRIFATKFQRTTNEELAILMLKVGCCIMAKAAAFSIGFYKMMNQLLKTIDITNRSSFENTIETVEAEIHIIAINSVCFFYSK